MNSKHVRIFLFLAISLASCADDDKPNDTLVNSSAIPPCTEDFARYTSFVSMHQFGLSVQNFYHHNIFYFDSKKAPWRPINGRRETLRGELVKYRVVTEHAREQKEYDWNLDVVPSAAFAPWMGEGMVQGEVTPALSFRNSKFFPPQGRESECPLVGKNICLYGPWVRDFGYNAQREIHPAEAIWWRTTPGSNADVRLVLVQDAAILRFTDNAHYDFDEDHDGTTDFNPHWAPWVTYPQVEEIKIPFIHNPGTGRYHVIRIEEEDSLNVVTSLYRDLEDSDNGPVHKLKVTRFATEAVDQPTLVEVRESVDSHLGVQFTDICKLPTGMISGYVRVLVAIGRANTRDPGFMALRFRKSLADNKLQTLP